MPKLPSRDTSGKLFIYNPDTGDITWRHREDASLAWNRQYAGKRTFTSKNKDGYLYSRFINPDTGRSESHLAHRIAYLIHHEISPPPIMDHANGVRTDNRICNLRAATGTQNRQNKGGNMRSTSRFIGVHWAISNRKWRAMIRFGGKSRHIGMFDSEEDAARARDQAALAAFGDFARLNFPS